MSTIATTLRRSAVTALVAAGAMFASAPAEAARLDCDPGRFCIWEHSNYTGRTGEFATGVKDLSEWASGVLNDKTSAIYNRTGNSWCIYTNKNRGGSYSWIWPGDYGALTASWNDKISSVLPVYKVNLPSGGYYWTC